MSPSPSVPSRGLDATLAPAQIGALVDSLSVGIVVQSASGEVEYCNPKSLELLQLSSEEFLGLTPAPDDWRVIAEDGRDVPPSERPSALARRMGQAIRQTILGVRRSTASEWRWLEVSCDPIAKEGDGYRVALTMTDVTARKAADAAHASADAEAALLRQALDTVPAVVFAKDRDSRYTYANRAAQEFVGKSLEQIVGTSDWDFFPAELAERHRAVDLRVLAGESTNEEFSGLGPNGKRSTFLELKSPLPPQEPGGEAPGLLGISIDVTAQHEAQARVERLSALYAALTRSYETIALGASEEELYREICRAVVEVGGVKMAWIGFENPETRRIEPVTAVGDDHGYLEGLVVSSDPDDPRSQGPTGSAFREGRPVWLADFRTDARTTPWHDRARISGWISSAAVPLFRAGKTVGALTMYATEESRFTEDSRQLLSDLARGLGLALDRYAALAEHARAERALRESFEQYEQLFDGMLSGLILCEVILDAHGIPTDHRYLRANRAFEVITGLKATEVVGQRFSENTLGIPADLLPRLYRVAATGEPIQYDRFNERFQRHFETRVFSPKRGQFAFAFTDITERRALEEQLRQSQKMESVGRLAGGVAHDFNNMLSVILGHVELALSSVDPGTSLEEDLREVQSAAQRSAEMTRRLLAFARKQTVSPEVLDLGREVTSAFKLLKRLISEDIALEMQLAPDLWWVYVDAAQLDQILANLCVNARDAIIEARKRSGHNAADDRVVLSTENRHLDATFCTTHGATAGPGDYVLLSVTDSGSGMSDEVREHIFEPFFTTKKPGEGTGLGLATVFGAVRQANGFIVVTSAPGAGSRFDMYFPRELTRQPVDTSKLPSSVTGGGETILVVEDDPPVLKMTVLTLRRLGYRVLSASGAEEAFAVIDQHPSEIDLLLTDVIMPKMNGRQLVEALLKRMPDLRYLYMSGYTADVLSMSEGEVHDHQLLAKPFTLAQLAERVREALGTQPHQASWRSA